MQADLQLTAFGDHWPPPPAWLDEILPRRLYEGFDGSSAALQLKGHSPTEVREWILRICSEMEVAPSYLATKAGLAASTLNRFLRQNENETSNLTATTINHIKGIVEKEFHPRLDENKALWRELEKGYYRSKRVKRKEKVALGKKDIELLRTMPTGPSCDWPRRFFPRQGIFHGKLAHSTFFSKADWIDRGSFNITLPISSRGDVAPIIAMEVGDESCGKVYEKGAILLAKMLCMLEFTPPLVGENVIVFRRRDDGHLECAAWQVAVDPAYRFWLMPVDSSSNQEGIFIGTLLDAKYETIYVSHIIYGSYLDQT